MSHLVVDRRARKCLTWERASVDRRAAMRTAALVMLCAVAAGTTAIVECDGEWRGGTASFMVYLPFK